MNKADCSTEQTVKCANPVKRSLDFILFKEGNTTRRSLHCLPGSRRNKRELTLGLCLREVKLCEVTLCGVKRFNINLCEVTLCKVTLCDVTLCEVTLFEVTLCEVTLHEVRLCEVNYVRFTV